MSDYKVNINSSYANYSTYCNLVVIVNEVVDGKNAHKLRSLLGRVLNTEVLAREHLENLCLEVTGNKNYSSYSDFGNHYNYLFTALHLLRNYKDPSRQAMYNYYMLSYYQLLIRDIEVEIRSLVYKIKTQSRNSAW